VIAGAGFAGLALALALMQASRGGLSIVVVDPAVGSVPRDARAPAIAAGARRMLETLRAWPEGERDSQPILDMIVTDSRVADAARPVFLSFAGEAAPGEPFAHMVENAVLLDALTGACAAAGVRVVRGRVDGVWTDDGYASVRLEGGHAIRARLVAACDGARSRLREAAGIAMTGWDYGQSGIVTTVVHERPHGGRAEEHFLPAGPFAILPLPDDAGGRHRSSIVWTETTAEADRLVAAGPPDFRAAFMDRFGHRLGDVEIAAPARAYPLSLRIARRFVSDRLALVGDAAHVIHPIAGQGLNMGLRDVAALAETVLDAFRLGEDIGALDVLERYERWRRFDTAMMGVATDGLNRLFATDNGLVRGLRDFGLGIVDRLPPLKDVFVKSAAGLLGAVPKLMQGRAL